MPTNLQRHALKETLNELAKVKDLLEQALRARKDITFQQPLNEASNLLHKASQRILITANDHQDHTLRVRKLTKMEIDDVPTTNGTNNGGED